MSSNKMSPRTQVKKNKNQKITDKTDKAMSDIKKIGIVSCGWDKNEFCEKVRGVQQLS